MVVFIFQAAVWVNLDLVVPGGAALNSLQFQYKLLGIGHPPRRHFFKQMIPNGSLGSLSFLALEAADVN